MTEIGRITKKLIRIEDLLDKVDVNRFSKLTYPSVHMKKESARKVKRLLKFKEFYLDKLQLATCWEQGETSNLKRDTNLTLA